MNDLFRKSSLPAILPILQPWISPGPPPVTRL